MVGGLTEVILYVRDMQAQLAFYTEVLGLHPVHPEQLANATERYWVELATGACTLALHGGGKADIGKDAPKIVFATSDIVADREAITARGGSLGAIRSPAEGVLVCDGKDPEGNAYSLEQR
jgi:catechol 2,3-dioxygenase-like lactoylglutathione lyase family enzyme